jgi:filamentous hemagglutinin
MVKEKSIDEKSDQTLQGAAVNVKEGLTINTGNNLNLVASEVNVGGDADITAGNNINVLSAEEVDTEYSFYEKTNYLTDALKAMGSLALAGVTGGASLLVVNDGIDVNCSGGHCGASVEIGSQTTDESFTKTTTSVGSAIKVGGDLKMDAGNDINIKGSDIAIGGDGEISAGNDINILEAKNSTEHSNSHSDTTITAGVQVGNAYVDAGFAAYALYEAGDAVVKASEALKHMKDLRDQGKASDEAVRDAEFNLAMASLNLVNAELAAVSSVAGAATAGSSSFGTGLYGSASLNFETNKDSFGLNSTQSVGSTISGTNLTFTSGNNTTQIGSDVIADNTITYDVGNDLNVLASTDTYRTTSDSESISAGVSVGNNAVQITAGYDTSSNTASGTTHNNSTVQANTVIVKTGGDATFAGADVNATEELKMEIEGDLNVASVQDTDYSKGNSWGVNAGFGFGYGENAKGEDQSGNRNGSGGFHVGSSNHDSAWVNDQTELTGGKVDISVGGKTTVTGAVIAAGEYDENGKFVDNGDLTLATNEFEYKDLHDFNTSSESGFGFSTSMGGAVSDKDEFNMHPQGSTTITAKSTGSESEQTTRATVGDGTITVGGNENPDLAGLNRDVDKAQEVTKDMITGALDGSVTVDNCIFTEEGRAQIVKQHEDFVDNVEQIGEGLRSNIITRSIENYITDDTKSLGEVINEYIQKDEQATQLVKERQDLIQKVYGLTNLPPEEARGVMQEYIDILGADGGFAGALSISNVNGNLIGLSYQSEDGTVQNITLNLAKIDITNPKSVLREIYHETTNFEQHKANEQTAVNRGNTGAGIFALKTYGTENTNSMSSKDWLIINNGSETIQNGNMSLISDIQSYAAGNGSVATDRMDAVLLRAASEHDDVKDTWIGRLLGAEATKQEIENPPTATEIAINAYDYIDNADPDKPTSEKILFAVGAGAFNEQNIYQREFDAVETSLNNPIAGADGTTYYMLNGGYYTATDMQSFQNTAKQNLENAQAMNTIAGAVTVGTLLIPGSGSKIPGSGMSSQFGGIKNPFYKAPIKLTTEQSKNLGRFNKSWSKTDNLNNPIKVVPDGENVKFIKDVPASNIPGSHAVYEKTVNSSGRTIDMHKTTYAPDGSIVHTKDKINK